jgi:hypothetical protein
VTLPTADGAPEKVIVEFKPCMTQDMLVACLWSRWQRAAVLREPFGSMKPETVMLRVIPNGGNL